MNPAIVQGFSFTGKSTPILEKIVFRIKWALYFHPQQIIHLPSPLCSYYQLP